MDKLLTEIKPAAPGIELFVSLKVHKKAKDKFLIFLITSYCMPGVSIAVEGF